MRLNGSFVPATIDFCSKLIKWAQKHKLLNSFNLSYFAFVNRYKILRELGKSVGPNSFLANISQVLGLDFLICWVRTFSSVRPGLSHLLGQDFSSVGPTFGQQKRNSVVNEREKVAPIPTFLKNCWTQHFLPTNEKNSAQHQQFWTPGRTFCWAQQFWPNNIMYMITLHDLPDNLTSYLFQRILRKLPVLLDKLKAVKAWCPPQSCSRCYRRN